MTTEKAVRTAEDLLRVPNDGWRYELLHGDLVRMSPTGGKHGQITTRFASWLSGYVEPRKLGAVLSGDVGIVLAHDPDHVRAPAVCFIRRERLPGGEVPDEFLEIVPDLVVEVISKHDRASEVHDKIKEWLDAGVRLVLAVYPTSRTIVAHESLSTIRVYTAADELTCGPVLPELAVSVGTLFE